MNGVRVDRVLRTLTPLRTGPAEADARAISNFFQILFVVMHVPLQRHGGQPETSSANRMMGVE